MDARFNNTLLALTIASQCLAGQPENQKAENTSSGIKPLNVVFILSDDHRYDSVLYPVFKTVFTAHQPDGADRQHPSVHCGGSGQGIRVHR